MAKEIGYIRFTMNDISVLLNILDRLRKFFNDDEMEIYVKSKYLKSITINNLFKEINRRW